ncbi:MAG: radical SAM protein [Clostridia bacterium]|nr:radical SAM protein [Clostridia bacterium]
MINGFSRNEIADLIWEKPYFTQIELTRNCNFSCKFCFENCDYGKKYEDKSLDEWKYVIDNLYSLGVKHLHFSGGENFLYKYYKELLQYAKQKDFRVLVNTNGYFDITNVLDYVDDFVFSVHGYKDVHDEIVNKKGAFDKVEKNIEIAVNANKNVSINSVLIKENLNDYLNLYNYFYGKYKNKVKYSPTLAIPCKTGKKIDNLSVDLNKENMDIYLNILNTVGEQNLVYKHGLHGLCSLDRNENDFFMPVCAAGKSKLIIKYNGNVYPCNFFQTDEYLCGNVFQQDLKEIWKNGKGFNVFRSYYLCNDIPDECQSCKKKNNCYSGCRAWTKSYINGDMSIKKERDDRCEIINAYIRA